MNLFFSVAVTACVISDSSSSPLQFGNIITQVGINNIESFKSTGKFTCETPGLYFVSANLWADCNSCGFYLRKNGVIISYGATTYFRSGDGVSGSGINAVVEAQKNDQFYFDPNGSSIRKTWSCITIMKMK